MARNQKTIEFSSASIKQFIEDRTAEIAAEAHTTKAYVIESLILDGLLPKDKDVRFLVQNFLYGAETNGIQKTLSNFFSQNASGVNWMSRHSNCKSLVDFCIRNIKMTSIDVEHVKCLPHMREQLRSIIKRIERCTAQCIELEDRAFYEMQLSYAKRLYQIAENTPAQIVVKSYLELVQDCWPMLNNWTITYRYLMDMCDMAQFNEDSQTRSELFGIINTISLEWGKEKAYD